MDLIRANPGFDYVGPGMILRLPKLDPRVKRQRKIKRRDKLYGKPEPPKEQATTQVESDAEKYERILGLMEGPEEIMGYDFGGELRQDEGLGAGQSAPSVQQPQTLQEPVEWWNDPAKYDELIDLMTETLQSMGLDEDAMMEEFGMGEVKEEPEVQPAPPPAQQPQMAGDEADDPAEPDQSGTRYPEPETPPQPDGDEEGSDDISEDVSDSVAGETEDDEKDEVQDTTNGAPKVLERPVVEEPTPTAALQEDVPEYKDIETLEQLHAWLGAQINNTNTDQEEINIEMMYMEKKNELSAKARNEKPILPTIGAITKKINERNPKAYSIEDLHLDRLSGDGLEIVAGALNDKGIELNLALQQMDTLQKYWGFDNSEQGKREYISYLRELFYENALDPFLAGAKDVTRKDIRIKGDSNGVLGSDAQLAYSLLLLSSKPGKKEPITPITIAGNDEGIDHVLAGLDAYFHPIETSLGVEDSDTKKGLKMLGVNPDSGGDIQSLPAVTYVGDMAAFVRSSLQYGDAPLEDIIDLEFPDHDFEGDIMATVIVNSGLLANDGLSVSQVLQIAYNPEGDIFPNRYQLFAKAVGLLLDPESREFTDSSKRKFIDKNRSAVESLGLGLYGADIIKKEGSLGEAMSAGWKMFEEHFYDGNIFPGGNTDTIFNWFLDKLEEKVRITIDMNVK